MEAIKKILSLKIVLFLLLLAVIWMGLVSVKAHYRKNQLDQEVSSLKKEINKLDKSDQELSQLIKYFNNQDFLEKEVKDKLNLKAEGESVVMVPEGQLNLEAAAEQQTASSASAVATGQQSGEQKNKTSNIVRWWNYLFGR